MCLVLVTEVTNDSNLKAIKLLGGVTPPPHPPYSDVPGSNRIIGFINFICLPECI